MNPSSSASQLQKATSRVAFFLALRIHLSWLLVLFLVQSVWAETWRVRVSTVLDGDTVVLEGGERLRLRGIDAPEIRHGSTPRSMAGRESLVMLRDLVKGRDLFLDRTELTSDRYGRWSARPVWLMAAWSMCLWSRTALPLPIPILRTRTRIWLIGFCGPSARP